MKITVTRALAELKLLDARILKEIDQSGFCDVYQNRSKVVMHHSVKLDEFEKKVKASMQSIEDLIKRRKVIKSQVMKSNSLTIVKVNDQEFTVADAIEYKSSIKYEMELLTAMRESYTSAKDKVDRSVVDIDNKVQQMLLQSLGADAKENKDDWEKIAKPFIDQNAYNLSDPLNLKDKIQTKEQRLDEFRTEVDFILSESNSRTEIEIED